MRTRPAALLLVAGFAAASSAWAEDPTDAITILYRTCVPTFPTGGPCGSVAIPDNGVPVELTLNVPSDPNGNTIVSVVPQIWIEHAAQGDLRVELISPAGTVVTLLDRPGLSNGTPFTNDDFGGFFACTSSPTNFQFRGMFFRDQTFCFAANPQTFVPDRYDTPDVAAPGIAFDTPVTVNCAVLPCTDRFGPWSPKTLLSQFNGQSKAGTWRLRVRDLDPIAIGNIRYLGLSITTTTQPTATIASPAPFACVCNGQVITGTATDAGGSIERWNLEWASSPNGPWTLINSGTSVVNNGPLGAWNTTAVPEGPAFLRLTVENVDGTRSQTTTVVQVDKAFNGAVLRGPVNGQILGGNVCFDGTAFDVCFQSYNVEYAAGPGFSTFFPVDPSSPVYGTSVTNDPLAVWNTRTGGAAVVDGTYRVRLRGTTVCGNAASVSRDVVIDNTAPNAVIASPAACSNVCGNITITGTVLDANLAGWVLQYAGGGSGWTTIASGTSNVNNGVLGVWNTAGLPRCAYALRLIARDQAGVDCSGFNNEREVVTLVNLGAYSNCDGSTGTPVLTPADFVCFLNRYRSEGTCPQ